VRPCLDLAFRTAFIITRDAADAEDALAGLLPDGAERPQPEGTRHRSLDVVVASTHLSGRIRSIERT